MDLTHESNITGGTIKKLILNLSSSEGPCTEQALQGTERKVTQTVNLSVIRKQCMTNGLYT